MWPAARLDEDLPGDQDLCDQRENPGEEAVGEECPKVRKKMCKGPEAGPLDVLVVLRTLSSQNLTPRVVDPEPAIASQSQ